MRKRKQKSTAFSFKRFLLKCLVLLIGLGVCAACFLAATVVPVWQSLPSLSAMTDYRPRLPLRIYTADRILLAEYGDERRHVLNLQEIPLVMRQAILAAEDDGFYQHGGVDWRGVIRATLANVTTGARAQGASTITMQLARNFYLSSEKTFYRKFYELLLTYKIESTLTKDQILELYMNQIYLGHRSYGFAAAARTYFNKNLSDITLAEAAALASIPKSPSRTNPRSNLQATTVRQHYVLNRMLQLKYINAEQMAQAKAEDLSKSMHQQRTKAQQNSVASRQGQYVAELARQLLFAQYGDAVYGRGLNVYTTVHSQDQAAAHEALRNGVLNYTRRKPFEGPVGKIDVPKNVEKNLKQSEALLQALRDKHPNNEPLQSAVILSANQKSVRFMHQAGKITTLRGNDLEHLIPWLQGDKPLRRGDVIYVEHRPKVGWRPISFPKIQGAFVALDPRNGAIKALVGGFDFQQSDFNRAVQAWRQPGSTFKPFIYAAALERGITPQTQVSDQPYFLTADQTGSGKPWEPKNAGDRYDISLSLRQGLAYSRNMVSIRVLEAVGPTFLHGFLQRLGFDLKRHPSAGAYLTTALGAGNVTPLQMAAGYAIFANGGFKIAPYLIDSVEDVNVPDSQPVMIMKARPPLAGAPEYRVLDPRTAYVVSNMLTSVVRGGAANSINYHFTRKDLAGKTGTTNQSFDAWFAGYMPELVAVSWLGFDQLTSLGEKETGSGVALPVWIQFMKKALANVPEQAEAPLPDGLYKTAQGRIYYAEFPPSVAIRAIGVPESLVPELPLEESTIEPVMPSATLPTDSPIVRPLAQ